MPIDKVEFGILGSGHFTRTVARKLHVYKLLSVKTNFLVVRTFLSLMCVHVSIEVRNFSMIDVILMDSFLCIHHIGLNVIKISLFRLALFSVLLKTRKF